MADPSTDPLDVPLPADVDVAGMVFRQGVSLRTFVNAAARWKEAADGAFVVNVTPGAVEEFRKLMEDGR